jgi:ectoine hydroxylase-related dioxygenase (phytanoyl-CoA dioxygenase family)
VEKIYDFAANYQSDNEMKDYYDQNGYVSIKNGISREDIEEIVDDLTDIFSQFATDPENQIDSAIVNLDKSDKPKLHELHQVASKICSFGKVTSSLSKYVNAIYGKRVPQFNISSGFLLGIPKDERLVYNFHQESNYMKGFEDIFNIHYPLLRTSSIENGTMSVIAGTHKLKTLDFEKAKKSDNSYTDLVPVDIEHIKESFEERHNFLEVGDVLVFH